VQGGNFMSVRDDRGRFMHQRHGIAASNQISPALMRLGHSGRLRCGRAGDREAALRAADEAAAAGLRCAAALRAADEEAAALNAPLDRGRAGNEHDCRARGGDPDGMDA
jgi:hypothetical protein